MLFIPLFRPIVNHKTIFNKKLSTQYVNIRLANIYGAPLFDYKETLLINVLFSGTIQRKKKTITLSLTETFKLFQRCMS